MYGGESVTVTEVKMGSSSYERLHHWLWIAERHGGQRQRRLCTANTTSCERIYLRPSYHIELDWIRQRANINAV